MPSNGNSDRIAKAIAALTKSRVLIGIPGDARHASADGKGTVNTAVIGYMNELGDPERNIPARPFLAPGVEDIKDAISKQLAAGAAGAFAGNIGAVDDALHGVGLLAVSSVRGKIIEGNFAPLSQRTLEARARRRTESGAASRHRRTKDAKQELANRAAGMEASAAIAKPLIDTGELMSQITYVVKR